MKTHFHRSYILNKQPRILYHLAAPVSNGAKEIALNKPDAFNGNREKLREFLQTVKIYMDINHEIYKNDLVKIAFVLSFMSSGPAATWTYQFAEEKMKLPPPRNPNNKLGQYANFRKDLVDAFSHQQILGIPVDAIVAIAAVDVIVIP